jgi:hypothetical protein
VKITVITLYVGDLCEHYVGAVEGSLDLRQRKIIAQDHNAVLSKDADVEEPRVVYFREVNVDAARPTELLNISDDE